MLRIYGHSDDCVEIEGDVNDEIGAFERARVITIGGEGEGVIVRAAYAPDSSAGVWRLSVELVEEGVPCPWPIRIEPRHSYSQQIVIDCPPGTPVGFDDDNGDDE